MNYNVDLIIFIADFIFDTDRIFHGPIYTLYNRQLSEKISYPMTIMKVWLFSFQYFILNPIILNLEVNQLFYR